MSVHMILKPRLSEKTYAQSAAKVYAFDVPLTANKQQIADAVAAQFDVTVTDVRTTIRKGKQKRVFRGRSMFKGQRKDVKVAYVSVGADDEINVFPKEA